MRWTWYCIGCVLLVSLLGCGKFAASKSATDLTEQQNKAQQKVDADERRYQSMQNNN
jgi:hypothetical protein